MTEQRDPALGKAHLVSCSAQPNRDLVFHLLDIQSRDMRIESEDEVAYESASDDDDEFQTKRKIQSVQIHRHERAGYPRLGTDSAYGQADASHGIDTEHQHRS